MAHNDHIIPYGLWTSKTVPTPSMMERMDLAASQSLNGYDGGTWAPETPIIVGGLGTTIKAGTLTGGVSTDAKSVARGIRLGNVWPRFSSTRTRTVVFPITGNCFKHSDILPIADLVTVPSPVGYTVSGGADKMIVPLPSFRMVHGATISSITLGFSAGTRPTGADSLIGPRFRLMAFSRDRSTMFAVASVPTWAALTPYIANQTVVGSPQTGMAFVCTSGGTSGASQPAAFSTAVSHDSITDASVTWQALTAGADMVGTDFQYLYTGDIVYEANTLEYWNNGAPKTLTMSAPNVNPVLNTNDMTYYLWIESFRKSMVFHSLSISMTGITNMRPAV